MKKETVPRGPQLGGGEPGHPVTDVLSTSPSVAGPLERRKLHENRWVTGAKNPSQKVVPNETFAQFLRLYL